MSISELPKDTMSTEGTIADLIGDMTELQKDAAEMLVGAGFPHVAGMSNLAAHPMAAAAAASAIGMGLAGQFFGIMAGTMAGAMKAASMLAEETTGGHPAPGNPMNFDLASGSFDDTKIADPVTHQPPVKADASTQAASAKAPVKARTPVQSRTPVKVGSPAKASEPVKAAAVAKAKPAAKIAPKAAAAPKAAKASAPAARKKAPGVKAAPAAKKAPVAKPEPVALSATPAPVAAVKGGAIMPEDFRKPKALAKPDAPDDLKVISGVGPKLESVLNGLGVWTYGQIAEWTPEEVAWVDDHLSFSGRIERDGWIAQAKALADVT